jgi:hypothetical protein
MKNFRLGNISIKNNTYDYFNKVNSKIKFFFEFNSKDSFKLDLKQLSEE